MTEKRSERPAWAYTLSAAVVFIAFGLILGMFDDGRGENDFMRVINILGVTTAAGGAIQFLMARKE